MPNIVVALYREIARVKKLSPKLEPARQRQAEATIREAEQSMATNSLSGMKEALTDLEAFQPEQKK